MGVLDETQVDVRHIYCRNRMTEDENNLCPICLSEAWLALPVAWAPGVCCMATHLLAQRVAWDSRDWAEGERRESW